MCLAEGPVRAYLMGIPCGWPEFDAAVEPSGFATRPFMLVAAAGVLIAATMALWAHYGTAVFFEVVRSRYRGVLLTKSATRHESSRPPRIVLTLLVGLRRRVGSVLCGWCCLITGRGPAARSLAAVDGGRAISPGRPERQGGHRPETLKGKPFLVFFGFTALPGDLPDRVVRHVGGASTSSGPTPTRSTPVRHGRSRARHAGEAEGLSVELQSAPDRR